MKFLSEIKKKINEEVNPFSLTKSGRMDINDDSVRDNLNALLYAKTEKMFDSPDIALESVRKILAYYHIHLPKTNFESGDSDKKIFDVHQFGFKAGLNDKGSYITKGTVSKDHTHGEPGAEGELLNLPIDFEVDFENDKKYFIYFEYLLKECGKYAVFCAIIDQEEMEDLEYDDEIDSIFEDTFDQRFSGSMHDVNRENKRDRQPRFLDPIEPGEKYDDTITNREKERKRDRIYPDNDQLPKTLNPNKIMKDRNVRGIELKPETLPGMKQNINRKLSI